MIWYKFPKNVNPSEVTFFGHDRAPFQLVASFDANCDESSVWYMLCQDLSLDIGSRNKFCQVPKHALQKYASRGFCCVGLRLYGPAKIESSYFTISNIRLWGDEVDV